MQQRHLCALAAAACFAASAPAAARIVRLEIAKTEPAFGGRSFGAAGAYERVTGKAFGEVDPALPANAIIQDIGLAPKNARGMVEYSTDIDILRPADRSKSNGILFFNILNRGNKGGLSLFNADMSGGLAGGNGLTDAGDGFMQAQGYTMVWFGWQADVLAGGGRMTLSVPVARGPGGEPITGIVRSELTTARETLTAAPVTTLNLSSGWFTAMATSAYPTAGMDNRAASADGFLPSLTVRGKEQEPRVAIANSEWSFGACPQGGAAAPNETQICYPAGFRAGRIYELTYRAKDPLVLGLGFAATRDLGVFLKSAGSDSAGNANPVYVPGARAIVMGSSQSGRFVRSFIHLGFNRDETGAIAFEGALPHIGGGLIPVNVRFGQPGRAAGTEQVDRAFPGTEFPFAYGRVADPLTGRAAGILDRCEATNSCPRIVHAATALEMWELRQSLGFTDPLGLADLPEPANVRSYILSSTQHGAAALPLATAAPFGACQQQPNPNPHTWTMRALLDGLTRWVKDGAEPPPSARPTIAAGTLVAADQVRFPPIPANAYGNVPRPAVKFTGLHNALHAADFGEDYRAEDTSGLVAGRAPRLSAARYGNLVAQVDADGNDLDGIRNVYVQAPIGTYTGWNLFNRSFFEDGFCTLQGSFIPFARTKQERLDAGDPRLSIEERYPTPAVYAEAVRIAAADLVARRFLLAQDAQRLVNEAAGGGIRLAP